MNTCPQLDDLEELVLDTTAAQLDTTAAQSLREHASVCAACRAELAMLTAERALFARRAHVVAEPPASLAFSVREAIGEEASSERARRAAPSIGIGGRIVHVLRRGHFSAACAAALFLVAAFSRLGTATTFVVAAAAPIHADGEEGPSGILASMRPEESLACSTTFGAVDTNDDVGVWSSSSPSPSLTCGGSTQTSSGSGASCEPFVTCSALRQ